jgi:hypothetical protein
MDRIEYDASNNSSLPLKMFTELLRINGRDILAEPLPRNDKGIFTEPLPRNEREIHIETHRFVEEIYEMRG